MSKVLLILNRREIANSSLAEERVKNICDSLNPDNIIANPSYIFSRVNILYGISNPVDLVRSCEKGVLLGQCLSPEKENLFLPHSMKPDGNYALFRFNDTTVECITDIVSSRTIWYYMDEEIFVASTSQIAIIKYIGGFQFNDEIIPWMLSSGTLGPSLSWDKRVKKIQPDTILRLDRLDWRLSIDKNETPFKPHIRSEKKAKEKLKATIAEVFKNTQFDFSKWGLPLSGGYDSRGILLFLKLYVKDLSNLVTLTWGLEKSRTRKHNDAYVAERLAEKVNVNNTYYTTDISEESTETIINRFIHCSEGQTDAITAYMDGMKIWKTFFESGIQGIIRGDEGFGWSKVSSALTARISTGLVLCKDIPNLKNYQSWGLKEQNIPETLKKKEGETIETWRDRLYHQFRIPVILSALSDIKLSYIEQSNPFLSNSIIRSVRGLPDNLRTNKRLFKEIVNEIGPELEYAKEGANESHLNVLKNPSIISLIIKELNSDIAKEIFSSELINHILKKLEAKSDITFAIRLKIFIGKYLPNAVKNKLKDRGQLPSIHYSILGFRLFIIIRIYSMLKKDSLNLKTSSI